MFRRREVSPSYSPTAPPYEEHSDEVPVAEAESPILWEPPSSPGGWSDSTVPWPNSDVEVDEEDVSSPWPIMANTPETGTPSPDEDNTWDYVWSGIRREDQQDDAMEETSDSIVSDDSTPDFLDIVDREE